VRLWTKLLTKLERWILTYVTDFNTSNVLVLLCGYSCAVGLMLWVRKKKNIAYKKWHLFHNQFCAFKTATCKIYRVTQQIKFIHLNHRRQIYTLNFWYGFNYRNLIQLVLPFKFLIFRFNYRHLIQLFLSELNATVLICFKAYDVVCWIRTSYCHIRECFIYLHLYISAATPWRHIVKRGFSSTRS